MAPPRPPPAHPVADQGVVTRALLGIVARGGREHALAEQICRACVAGLDVDGAGALAADPQFGAGDAVGHRPDGRAAGRPAVHPERGRVHGGGGHRGTGARAGPGGR